jgi:hypothetical protein
MEIDNLKGNTLILMDCGGGTFEQFRYHYPPEVYEKRLI